MTLAPALVLLSDRDEDWPSLPGIATVSKDDVGDHGAYASGIAYARRGLLWVDRPYFVGNPSVDWMVAKAERVVAEGGYCQVGNEQNHPDERWTGDAAAYHAFYEAVAARVSRPERLLYSPPSPGFADWRRWVGPAPAHAIHAYGDLAQMQGTVQWYLDHTSGELFITECNPGAGNRFDLNAWAAGPFRTFLDWSARYERIRMVAYFAWAWDQSRRLPSSIDARGTQIVDVLQAWRAAVATSSSATPSTAQPGAGETTTTPARPPPTEERPPMTTAGPFAGKLLTVWNLPSAPSILIDALRTYAFDGVEIKVSDGDSRWDRRRSVTSDYVTFVREAGFRVLGWSYNYCDGAVNAGDRGNGQPDREAAAAIEAIRELRLEGWTADLEIECEGHASNVVELLATVRAQAGVPIAAHTWAYLEGHGRYPSREIAENVDVLRPMIYRPEWQAARTWQSWSGLYTGRVVCPVLGITEADESALAEDIEYCKIRGVSGLSFWEYSGLPGRAGVADLLRRLSFGTVAPVVDATGDALNGVWQRLAEAEAAVKAAETAIQQAREEVVELKAAIGR